MRTLKEGDRVFISKLSSSGYSGREGILEALHVVGDTFPHKVRFDRKYSSYFRYNELILIEAPDAIFKELLSK